MQREIRTLWWLGQGLVTILLSLYFDLPYVALGFFVVHALGAYYSQFIQEEEQ